MENKQQLIDKAEQSFYKTYHRFPVIFESGKDVFLYDTNHQEYLDFGAGIAVMALGYNNDVFTEAIKKQADCLLHTSNLFYNQPSVEAAEKLLKVSAMDKVFFTNSGTEAIEGLFKIAKRYGFNQDGQHDHEIIAMKHSFHGRSLGALSLTGNSHYQDPFKPLIPGVKFAEFNNLDSVKALINKKTCAIIMEPIQGEGGIYPAAKDFIAGVKELCEKNNMLLLFDEIQCGMGRTGKMFAWQYYGVKPDAMAVAKALGNGVPIGAFLAAGKAADAMVPGDHGTTYGGNPLVCAAASKVLDLFAEYKITDHVENIAAYLAVKLSELKDQYKEIIAHRGVGLMQGLEFNIPVAPIVSHALLEEHLVLVSAGSNVIRFVPPLVIKEEHVDLMIKKLRSSLEASL